MSANNSANLVSFLFGLQIATKMFHWQTRSYAAHTEVGALHDRIVALADELMEQFIGVYGRPRMTSNSAIQIPNMTKPAMLATLRDGISFLSSRVPPDPHLQNIRDELTGEMARALFLLRLS